MVLADREPHPLCPPSQTPPMPAMLAPSCLAVREGAAGAPRPLCVWGRPFPWASKVSWHLQLLPESSACGSSPGCPTAKQSLQLAASLPPGMWMGPSPALLLFPQAAPGVSFWPSSPSWGWNLQTWQAGSGGAIPTPGWKRRRKQGEPLQQPQK